MPGDSTKPFVLRESDERDVVEIRARLLEELDQDREAARVRSGISAEEAKRRFDMLVKEDPLKEGEWVLMKNNSRLKFDPKWCGPFKVVKEVFKGVYKLKEPSGKLKSDLVHRDRLKRAKVGEKNPPKEFWSDVVLDKEDEELFWLRGQSQGGIDKDSQVHVPLTPANPEPWVRNGDMDQG